MEREHQEKDVDFKVRQGVALEAAKQVVKNVEREIEDLDSQSQYALVAAMVAKDPRVLQLAGLRATLRAVGPGQGSQIGRAHV